ncbi:MAG: hypothetical protein LBM05_00155 [Endomicrobium sp.]|jgi:hypothetical protein|nr:hypothetical protein [Endomicrobium sp.]
MLKYNFNNISISYDELLKRLGYIQNKTYLTKKILTLIEDIRLLALKIIHPKCSLAYANLLKFSKTSIMLDNGYVITSCDVSKLFQHCFKIYGIAVTIGIDLEKKVHDFIVKRELVNAVILDAAGSVAVENLIVNIHSQIKHYENINNNLLTKRYSPGYGDWLLKRNEALLNWIGAREIGIYVNKSYQMLPEKSISAILGVNKKNMSLSTKRI